MAGSIVPIQTGSPTQISGSNLNDMTLYNMSSTNAIWVGNSTAVAPDNGMRIGPLGTARWSKDSGLAYACVDTGVTSAINLNISNDISNPANPVDVATATAIALLAQGVPNVLVDKVLANQTLAAGGSITLDTSGQASLIINAAAVDNNANPVVFAVQWIDPTTGAGLEAFWLTIPGNAYLAIASWEMPVMAGQVTIAAAAGGQPINFQVIGSNRIVPKLRQHYNGYMPKLLSWKAGDWVNGTKVTLVSNDNVQDPLTRFNGPVKISVHMLNVAAINGNPILIASYPGSDRATREHWIFPPANGNLIYDWYHPPIPISWGLMPQANEVGPLLDVSISPAGSGF